MTTASKITLVRIALIPVFMVLFLWGTAKTDIAALLIFIIASATDGLDGYVARKFNQVSTFGKFIDPLADKLLVTAAILIFVERSQMAGWAAMIIIAREFMVTSLRLVALGDGKVIAAMLSGKIKMAVQVLCICLMMTPAASVTPGGGNLTLNDVFVFFMVVVTAASGVDYFIKSKNVLFSKQ